MATRERFTYREAGVDIDAGHALVERIKPLVKGISRPEVVGGLGGFAGLCNIPTKYKKPTLVSGTDGVGTKLKWAFESGRHNSVGIDLVAMCVNDILVVGAEPLFFMDYFATGQLDVEVGEAVVTGIVEGCKLSGCALLGGETAELPGMYQAGEYDLAGFVVGVVEADERVDGKALRAGDVLVGIASDGLHSNGHSLARKVIQEGLDLGLNDCPKELGGRSVADEVLKPTKIYAQEFAQLKEAGLAFHGAAHITGGGLIENPIRFVPKGSALGLEIHLGSWPVPGVFHLLAKGGVAPNEMRRTFNMGIGMVLAVPPDRQSPVLELLNGENERAWAIGKVTDSPTEGIVFTES